MANLHSKRWLFVIILLSVISMRSVYTSPYKSSNIIDTLGFIHPLDSVEPKMESAYMNGFNAYNIGDFVKADSFWTLSLKYRRNLFSETDTRIADNLTNLGAANVKLWNYEYAIKLLSEAERIYTNIDEDYINLGAIYTNFAIIYSALRDYEKALIYYNHAIFIYKNQKQIDYDNLFNTYRNLSNLYRTIEDYPKAIESITKGIYYDKTKSIVRLIDYNNLIAVYYSQSGNYPLAEKYYKEAIRLAKLNPNRTTEYSNLPSILMNYAVFQMDQINRVKEAKNLLYRALTLFNSSEQNQEENKTICLHNLGEAYYKSGKYLHKSCN